MTDPYFLYTRSGVTINGISYPLDLFLQLEPGFKPPPDCRTLTYIPGKQSYYTTDKSQYPFHQPWSDGDRYIKRGGDLKLLKIQNETDRHYFEYRSLINKKANGALNGNTNL
jgi:hypothetical protein